MNEAPVPGIAQPEVSVPPETVPEAPTQAAPVREKTVSEEAKDEKPALPEPSPPPDAPAPKELPSWWTGPGKAKPKLVPELSPMIEEETSAALPKAPPPSAEPYAPEAGAPDPTVLAKSPVSAAPWDEVFRIDRALTVDADGVSAAGRNCIARHKGFVLYCLEPVVWPDGVAMHFKVDTIMYRGSQAIVRYDGGKAVHVHALFDERAIDLVTAFLEDRFGPPAETFVRFAAPFERMPQDNPTYLWHMAASDGDGGAATTIEVRRFDTTQGGFPDMRHGVVRLYGDSSPPIFDLIRPRDLMLINFRIN